MLAWMVILVISIFSGALSFSQKLFFLVLLISRKLSKSRFFRLYESQNQIHAFLQLGADNNNHQDFFSKLQLNERLPGGFSFCF